MLTKKTFAIFWLILAVLLIGETSSAAQAKTNSVYAAPKRLMLKGDGHEKEEERVLLREKFYPLGWSKDGKFAYLVEPADEACGCYFANFVIQDLRTDKILWEHHYEGKEAVEETLQTYWKKYQREISRKLTEHRIIAQNRFMLRSASFAYGKDLMTPDLKVNVKSGGSDLDISGNIILQLISRQKGKKTLYEKVFDPDKYEAFLDAGLSGSLLSPFEPRAAVIMIETYRGYEGPPHTTQIRIVGADLEKSFR